MKSVNRSSTLIFLTLLLASICSIALCQDGRPITRADFWELYSTKHAAIASTFSDCHIESLSEFTNGSVVEQQFSLLNWVHGSYAQRDKLMTTAREGDFVVDAQRWVQGLEPTPELTSIRLRNEKYDAVATIGSRAGVQSVTPRGPPNVSDEEPTLLAILEGRLLGIKCISELLSASRPDALSIRMTEEGKVKLKITARNDSEAAHPTVYEWLFDEFSGTCLELSKADEGGVTRQYNRYSDPSDVNSLNESIILYPGGKAKRRILYKAIQTNANIDLNECYLSFYGFPEPDSEGGGLRIAIVVCFFLGITAISVSLWRGYSKRHHRENKKTRETEL